MTDTDIIAFLTRSGLIDHGTTPLMKPLTGGVSSDIWRVETASNAICVKRALPTLKTEKEWHAPVERNANEAEWFRKAAEIVPGAVPELLAEDRDAGMFAMAYLDPETNPLWKKELRDGRVTPEFAASVGATLGKIHAATANDDIIAERFATDEIFHAIRIEPYLLRTAETCPDVAHRLKALARVTAETRRVLVHGDVSPKNILNGAHGPVFLDAECAWYGDPAFDLAFCLNHLLLKCIWKPAHIIAYLASYEALVAAYLEHIHWEPVAVLETRTAALLPGLLLARIDGASPVEYITDEDGKDTVRRAARLGLKNPSDTLAGFRKTFRKELT